MEWMISKHAKKDEKREQEIATVELKQPIVSVMTGNP